MRHRRHRRQFPARTPSHRRAGAGECQKSSQGGVRPPLVDEAGLESFISGSEAACYSLRALIAQIASILFSTSISCGIHYYVWRRMVRDPGWPPRARRVATVLMIVMFVGLLSTMWARLNAPALATALGWVAMPWMVAVGLTAVWHGAMDLVRLGSWAVQRVRGKPRRVSTSVSASTAADGAATATATASPASSLDGEPANPDRRIFLARAAAGTALVASAASISAGMVSARGEHEIVTVEVPIPRLPRSLDGFTIAQLTDLHVGVTIDAEFVRRVVERTNALEPDLIALTGDLVDGPVSALRRDAAPLGELRAKHGVFAVTGNHEYYSGAEEWIAELTRLGVRYLRNEHVTIGATPGAMIGGFDLAGIDDHSAHRWKMQGKPHGADLAAALRDRDPTRALILLAHQPRQVRDTAGHDVDLQLSGHTHGGQVWPWHYLVKAQQGGLLAGLYEREGTRVYVSRGCGYFGPPVRVGAPLEISRIVLRAA